MLAVLFADVAMSSNTDNQWSQNMCAIETGYFRLTQLLVLGLGESRQRAGQLLWPGQNPLLEDGIASPDGIAEVARVAPAVSCRDGRSICGRECRKERMAVLKVDPSRTNRPERCCVSFVAGAMAHSIRDEDH